MEEYRSGHNELDSKDTKELVFSSAQNPCGIGLDAGTNHKKLNSSLLKFSPFSSGRNFRLDTERYRSGHNGADSKSV